MTCSFCDAPAEMAAPRADGPPLWMCTACCHGALGYVIRKVGNRLGMAPPLLETFIQLLAAEVDATRSAPLIPDQVLARAISQFERAWGPSHHASVADTPFRQALDNLLSVAMEMARQSESRRALAPLPASAADMLNDAFVPAPSIPGTDDEENDNPGE